MLVLILFLSHLKNVKTVLIAKAVQKRPLAKLDETEIVKPYL